jgi:hypothetical protein
MMSPRKLIARVQLGGLNFSGGEEGLAFALNAALF